MIETAFGEASHRSKANIFDLQRHDPYRLYLPKLLTTPPFDVRGYVRGLHVSLYSGKIL